MKKCIYFLSLLTLGICTLIFTGCASIFGWGRPEELNIRSAPEQASIVIVDETGTKIFEGKTPTIISLEKKKGYFKGKKYSVTISKDGFADKTIAIDTTPNGWYIGGNLLFGGLIGWLIVDPLTGAMWTLDTNEVNVTLESQPAASLDSNEAKVVLLKDVPDSLRDKMVRITE